MDNHPVKQPIASQATNQKTPPQANLVICSQHEHTTNELNSKFEHHAIAEPNEIPDKQKKKRNGKTKWDNQIIRKPVKGSKTETILTLATSTPATPIEIAKIVNCSKQNVFQALERYGIQANDLETYKEYRAEILAGVQVKLLQEIDADKLKDASINNLAYAYSQFHTAERLARDQSTTNLAIDVSSRLAEALARAKQPVDKS